MSAQFGKFNFEGRVFAASDLDDIRLLLAPHGPDGEGAVSKDGLLILYRALHATREARVEVQPHVSASGAVITWDGRLDNRPELIERLRLQSSDRWPDVSIVAAAYEQWGTGCFANLVGDWAVSICEPKARVLLLAKDFVGIRPLYYSTGNNEVIWSTVLDPLVLLAGRSLVLEEEYLAGWLSFYSAPDLTPYVGIHSVSPCSFVRLTRDMRQVTKYWDFDPGKRIRYRTDQEYEEQFRAVFAESVRRRLRADRPILAELSGGMDSSSIVCVADEIIRQGRAETPQLDTVSYFDDSEPNWNERPYFAKVEEKRGRTGCHVNLRSQTFPNGTAESRYFAALPSSVTLSGPAVNVFAECMAAQGSRVLLSGLGGDEVTGGVPTPFPELANLVAQAQLRALAQRLRVWALNKRKPWFHLLFRTLRDFLPAELTGTPAHLLPPFWLTPGFVGRNYTVLVGYPQRLILIGPLPSFQANLQALNGLRRQLAARAVPCHPPHETRYPYLDRDLLEFLYAIPRDQLVRPGQRRSLMRRALAGTVPQELLDRRRKAYATRSPIRAIATAGDLLLGTNRNLISVSMQIVDPVALTEAIEQTKCGREVAVVPLMRTLGLELWLRSLSNRGAIAMDMDCVPYLHGECKTGTTAFSHPRKELG